MKRAVTFREFLVDEIERQKASEEKHAEILRLHTERILAVFDGFELAQKNEIVQLVKKAVG